MAKNYDDLDDKTRDLIVHATGNKGLEEHKKAVLDHLGHKMLRNEYDGENAQALWLAHADLAAKGCCDIHGEPGDVWHKMYPQSIRKEMAAHLEELHREHLKHRHEHHEAEEVTGEILTEESAFNKLKNKIKRKEGYSEKGAEGAAAAAGRKNLGQKEMTRRAQAGKKKANEGLEENDDPMRPLFFKMLNAAINGKAADLKPLFNEAIQPNIQDAIERMKDDLRRFVFDFTNGVNVTNEPVQETEAFINEASRHLLANYAKKKKPVAPKDFWNDCPMA